MATYFKIYSSGSTGCCPCVDNDPCLSCTDDDGDPNGNCASGSFYTANVPYLNGANRLSGLHAGISAICDSGQFIIYTSNGTVGYVRVNLRHPGTALVSACYDCL